MLVIMDHREEMRERNPQPCKASRINQLPMRLQLFQSIYSTVPTQFHTLVITSRSPLEGPTDRLNGSRSTHPFSRVTEEESEQKSGDRKQRSRFVSPIRESAQTVDSTDGSMGITIPA